MSTRPSWLQTLTHSSVVRRLKVAFAVPSSEQERGGGLEGRISEAALKYRHVPGVLSVVTLAVMRTRSSAEDPARGTGEAVEEVGERGGSYLSSDFHSFLRLPSVPAVLEFSNVLCTLSLAQ